MRARYLKNIDRMEYPKSKFGTIGFMRAESAPKLDVILCFPKEEDKLPFSLGT